MSEIDRLIRETNPEPGEPRGFEPQHGKSDGSFVRTSEDDPLPTKDPEIKAEIESLKAEVVAIKEGTSDVSDSEAQTRLQAIEDKLDGVLKTEVTGSNIAFSEVGEIEPGERLDIDLRNYEMSGNYKYVIISTNRTSGSGQSNLEIDEIFGYANGDSIARIRNSETLESINAVFLADFEGGTTGMIPVIGSDIRIFLKNTSDSTTANFRYGVTLITN